MIGTGRIVRHKGRDTFKAPFCRRSLHGTSKNEFTVLEFDLDRLELCRHTFLERAQLQGRNSAPGVAHGLKQERAVHTGANVAATPGTVWSSRFFLRGR